MPTIEVFLMFAPSDRNSYTINKVTTISKGPDWDAIKTQAAKQGYTLVIHGPSIHPSAKEMQDSMSLAEVTLLVGHGAGSFGTKWVSNQITLSDGMIRSPDGVYTGKWNGLTLENASNLGKLKVNRVTGVFTCNSTEQIPNAFDLPAGNHLVTNDGGTDGFTRVGTLEEGAAAFVKEYAASKGDVTRAVTKAQFIFTQSGKKYAGDKGDTLSDNVGVAPPPPPPASGAVQGNPTP